MKELFKRWENLNAIANAADDAWALDPENEDLEKAFDDAYEAEWKVFNELLNAIVELTNGKIDKFTANKMLRSKRNEVKQLIERMA